MKPEQIKIEQDILDLCETIKKLTKGYDIYIGGGYLRDSNQGLTPKDVDFFFIPKGEYPYLPTGYVEGLGNPTYDYTNPTQDMKDRGVARVLCYHSLFLSTAEINFIVYDHYLSEYALAADFDFNVNQIVYDVNSDVFIWTKDYILGHENKTLECLHKFSTERMWKRFQRMKAKFPSYVVIGEPEATFIEQMLWSPSIKSCGSA